MLAVATVYPLLSAGTNTNLVRHPGYEQKAYSFKDDCGLVSVLEVKNRKKENVCVCCDS